MKVIKKGWMQAWLGGCIVLIKKMHPINIFTTAVMQKKSYKSFNHTCPELDMYFNLWEHKSILVIYRIVL